MYNPDSLPQTINIGIVGEKNFREIRFDMRQWLRDMSDGVPAIVYIRPTETEVHRPDVVLDGGIMTWIVTDTDLGAVYGSGKIQLEMKNATQTRKSAVAGIQVHPGIVR